MWGDNTKSVLDRSEEIFLPDYYKRNKYVGLHTYSGPGIYTIVVEDPNRNYGVSNIPNSVNTVFSISTTMYINPELGVNNTPVMTRAPLDKAAVGQIFIHNPGAYDIDGDSISYKLTTCREENGVPIPEYSLPAASNSIYVNEITGDLVWNTPMYAGIYNVAMLIEEWRGNVKIGEIVRDMQIEVFSSENKAPVINAAEYFCIEAEKIFDYTFSASDENNDNIKLTATGEPLIWDGYVASFTQIRNEPGFAEGNIKWAPECKRVRKQPYSINIKAEDNSEPIELVHMKNIFILVVGPAVKDVTIDATSTSILLNWNQNGCSNVKGYNVYRRISPSGFVPGYCEIGVPDEYGYTKIAYVEGIGNTSYEDLDVSQGHEYCYLICAVFPDEMESYASEEACISLLRGIPTITNVSVTETDENTGEIYVAWAKPSQIDIGEAPGPYQYVLYRSEGFFGESLRQIQTFDNLDDTTFVDTNLDTKNKAYSYKVELYNNTANNRFLIGAPHIASSVFLNLEQMENALKITFEKNVPWVNTEYNIFRYFENSDSFEHVGNANNEEYYIDEGLVNGKEYCYYARSVGSYTVDGFIEPIINLSQINCETAIDTTPPCAPGLKGYTNCDSTYNRLSWTYSMECHNDVEFYNLYYTPFLDGNYRHIFSSGADVFSYTHFPAIGMAGCYYVTAVDSFNNESIKSNVICLDNCSFYKLPNIFTPNGDEINDYFQPIKPYYFVTEINIKIFNRWGQLLFETNDPEINWDGINARTGKMVSDGVYFYECDVYEQRLTGIEVRHLQGFFHVANSTQYDKPPIE